MIVYNREVDRTNRSDGIREMRNYIIMSWEQTYERWLTHEALDSALKAELLALNEEERKEAFHTSLSFGTAGMRGVLGVGTNRMNIYTIRKANEGFGQYIVSHGAEAMARGIVIAYDSRLCSREFAEESARMMASKGIMTYLFENLRPTPELSFAVRYLHAFAGIVITASHNPAQYNGYKIYNETGAQVIPDEADKVSAAVAAVPDELMLTTDSLESYIDAGLIKIIGEEIDEPYNRAVVATSFASVPKAEIKVVYTALHGTGYAPVSRAFAYLGYEHVHYVEAQCKPDAHFTTAPSPNPELHEVFDLAIKLGNEVAADILLATDPDADRLGVAVKTTDSEYELLDGNTTGALMTYYILEQLQIQGELPANGVLFTTVVTSDFAEKIADAYGVVTERTLTGFKFIGDRIAAYETTGEKSFLFGFEESYGSLVNAHIARDKDAVQAVVILTEMAAYYKKQGKTLLDVLAMLQQKFGFFKDGLENINLSGIAGAAKIELLMSHVGSRPFTEMAGQPVTKFENYQTQTRYIASGQEETIMLPQSDVLKFYLADGSWFVLRPSGTEPKAKVYIAVRGSTSTEADAKLATLTADIMTAVAKILA